VRVNSRRSKRAPCALAHTLVKRHEHEIERMCTQFSQSIIQPINQLIKSCDVLDNVALSCLSAKRHEHEIERICAQFSQSIIQPIN
jgi:hypothetical protein